MQALILGTVASIDHNDAAVWHLGQGWQTSPTTLKQAFIRCLPMATPKGQHLRTNCKLEPTLQGCAVQAYTQLASLQLATLNPLATQRVAGCNDKLCSS